MSYFELKIIDKKPMQYQNNEFNLFKIEFHSKPPLIKRTAEYFNKETLKPHFRWFQKILDQR